ncbi:hypothetical protein GF336_05215, partial [Candidatus Woesearchaeota archaeon]|nr:hypothetical protein [Candidatus Woesearchaeota archaeon]
MKKNIFLGFCILFLLAVSVSAVTQNYETSAVSRIVGETPAEMENQLKTKDINLRHATIYQAEYPFYKTNEIIKDQFGSERNDMRENQDNIYTPLPPDILLDQEDFDQFRQNELFYVESGRKLNLDADELRPVFEDTNPLFILNADHSGLAIPGKESFIRSLAEDSTIIAPNFHRSVEFPRALLCNLRSSGRTAGETFRQARNNYHWGTDNKGELIGLTLFSYHLYGNPLSALRIPNYDEHAIKQYCQNYMVDYSSEQIISPYSKVSLKAAYGEQEAAYKSQQEPYTKRVKVNLGNHSIYNMGNYSLLLLDGASQDYTRDNLLLPNRIDSHEFPLKTIISDVSLASLDDHVDITIDDIPEWSERMVDRNCWENTKEAGIEFSHSFTEDTEAVIARINPVEIINCEKGEFRLYKTMTYEIKYFPYSPVLIENVEYPDVVIPEDTIDINVSLKNIVQNPVDGRLVIKYDNKIVAKKDIKTDQDDLSLRFKAPSDEGMNHYTLEFIQDNESKTKTSFDVDIAIINAELIIPHAQSSDIDAELHMYNYLDRDLKVAVKSSLYSGDEPFNSENYDKILSPGHNIITVPYHGLIAENKIYRPVIDIFYEGRLKTLTNSILLNQKPYLEHIDDAVVKEEEDVSIIVSASDEDGDELEYHIDDLRFTRVGDNKFVWSTGKGDAGEYEFEITVSDGYESASQKFNVLVNDVKEDEEEDEEKPICSKNSDCGINEFTGDPLCSSGNVYQGYITYECVNPGESSAECMNNTEEKIRYICEDSCSDGECVSIACSSDSDCGTDNYHSSSFCKEDDVYREYREYSCSSPGTSDARCSYEDKDKLITGCSEDCEQGLCVELEIECYSDSDCGDDDWTGLRYCKDEDSYRKYKDYECVNPGTAESRCE